MAQDEHGLFKWLSNIVRMIFKCLTDLNYLQDKFGFSFVSGVPPTAEATEELATRIGFIRETQCECHWIVKAPTEGPTLNSYARRQVLGLHVRPS